MLKPQDQTDLKAKILALTPASNFNSIYLWKWTLFCVPASSAAVESSLE